jgi:hypothetical protein
LACRSSISRRNEFISYSDSCFWSLVHAVCQYHEHFGGDGFLVFETFNIIFPQSEFNWPCGISYTITSCCLSEEPYWVLLFFTVCTCATSTFKQTNCSGQLVGGWLYSLLLITNHCFSLVLFTALHTLKLEYWKAFSFKLESCEEFCCLNISISSVIKWILFSLNLSFSHLPTASRILNSMKFGSPLEQLDNTSWWYKAGIALVRGIYIRRWKASGAP